MFPIRTVGLLPASRFFQGLLHLAEYCFARRFSAGDFRESPCLLCLYAEVICLSVQLGSGDWSELLTLIHEG